MNQLFKNIFNLFFLSVVIAPIIISVSFFVKQYHLKKNMEYELEKQYLQVVKIPLHQITWVEEGKELLIENKLFDVKKTIFTNEYAVLYGLFDEKEKMLHEALINILYPKNKNYSNNSCNNCFLIPFAANQHSFLDLHFLSFFSFLRKFTFFSISYTTRTLEVLTYPPII